MFRVSALGVAVALLLGGSSACSRGPDVKEPHRCAGVVGHALVPVAERECPSESPLSALSECPLSEHGEVFDAECLEAQPPSSEPAAGEQPRGVVGKLKITIEREDPGIDAEPDVTLDSRRLSPALLGAAFEVEPGPHVVDAWVRCHEPANDMVEVHEHGEAELTIRLKRLVIEHR